VVHTAANGKETLEHLDSCEPGMLNPKPYPSVILLDAVMPEMDGYTLVKTLQTRLQDPSAKIPIILPHLPGEAAVPL
jgi:CheY-like chemotaxis protein